MNNWMSHNLQLVRQKTEHILSQPSALHTLKKIKRGLEKESLRITQGGELAQTAHPEILGSALTNPNITTDFSEALLEFITPPFHNEKKAISFLKEIHAFIYQAIEQQDERLWVNSMPCLLPADNQIPIAQYGSSNSGQMKTIYRRGLGHRYGRTMQTIAGIHYNFSLPENFWKYYSTLMDDSRPLQTFIDDQYLKIIRNFQRFSWIPIYLFGASPAICQSFIKATQSNKLDVDIPSELMPLNLDTLSGTSYLPHGTSLRMSSIGYNNSAQSDLHICYNSLKSYIKALEEAIQTSNPDYENIGLFKGKKQIQLNSNILQIENEFYNTIRPKRTSTNGERPTVALQQKGIEYIEIRLLDLDPFVPGGVSEETLHFMDLLLIFSLFIESPLMTEQEQSIHQRNLQTVVTQGRNPTAAISTGDLSTPISINNYFSNVYPLMIPIAEMMDSISNTTQYSQALNHSKAKFEDSSLTPSHKIIQTLLEKEQNFFSFAMETANTQQNYFLNEYSINQSAINNFKHIASLSLKRQAEMEQRSKGSLSDYLAAYFSTEQFNSVS